MRKGIVALSLFGTLALHLVSAMDYAQPRKGLIADKYSTLRLFDIMGQDDAKVKTLAGISYEHYLLIKRRDFRSGRPTPENFKLKGIATRKAAFGEFTYARVAAEMMRLGIWEVSMDTLVAGYKNPDIIGLQRSAYLLAIAESVLRSANCGKLHLIPPEALTASCLFYICGDRLSHLTDSQLRGITIPVLETVFLYTAKGLLNEEARRKRSIFSTEQRRKLLWSIKAQEAKALHWGRFGSDWILDLL